MNFFLFFLALLGTNIRIQHESFEAPLGRNDLARTEAGHFYVIHRESLEVFHFDAQGKLLHRFAGKGNGPGELTTVTDIFYQNELVYLTESVAFRSRVLVYSKEGAYIKDLVLPGKFFFPQIIKVKNGWIVGDLKAAEPPKAPAQLVWYDEAFEEPVVFARGDRLQTGWVLTQNCKMHLNPVALPLLATYHAEQNLLYYVIPGSTEMGVFDVIRKAHAEPISLKFPVIPFDESWGNKVLRRRKQHLKHCQVVADFPKVFPIVSELRQSPFGSLEMRQWRKGSDGISKVSLYLDGQGARIKSPYSQAVANRVVLAGAGSVWMLFFDEENESYGIAEVPLSETVSFVKANPLPEW